MSHPFLRALPVFAVALIAPAAGHAAAARHAIPGSRPAWATSVRDRGGADASQPVTIDVYLPVSDPAAVAQLAQQVSDPTSPSYGQYLTPAQFDSRFAPGAGTVNAVEAFLGSAGLKVGDVPDNHAIIEATGKLSQAEQAFGVKVDRFAYRGALVDAPTSTPTVPAALSGDVVAVGGLDQGGALVRPLNSGDAGPAAAPAKPDAPAKATKGHNQPVPPPDGFRNAPPCSSYYGATLDTTDPPVNGAPAPYAPCGYTPGQLQGAYGLSGPIGRGDGGSGVTVAITDAYAAPTIEQDADLYAQRHGEAPFTRKQFAQITPNRYRYGYNDTVNGDQCGEQGWYGEETLDVEAVHAMAPAANVLYVAAKSCYDPDFVTALNKIVDKRKADIISNSWAGLESDEDPDIVSMYHQIFQQAAIEGISVMFSSGDDGDDSIDTADGSPATEYPPTDPLVTAVGGTSLGIGSDNRQLFQTGWATGKSTLTNDIWTPPYPGDFLYGGGGGVSSLFSEPWYQRAAVPASLAQGRRAVPDIAMDGDPSTGMLVGETQTFPDGVYYDEYRIGGTSLASPLMAGVAADIDQSAHRSLGFLNPYLYAAAGTPAISDVKPDGAARAVVRVDYVNSVDASDGLTTTLRSIDDEAQTLHLAPGWDDLTGVGSPNPAFLSGLG